MSRVEGAFLAGVAGLLLALSACGSSDGGVAPPPAPELRLGERLFRETRFAQSFAVRVAGRALNDPLPGSDPTVDLVETTGAPLPGPYAGLAMACAACHLSDETIAVPGETGDVSGGGVRAYCDFARRSPIPPRADGKTATARNAPTLLDAAHPRAGGLLFHDDAEFESLEALSLGTIEGRNFGWLPTERPAAEVEVARVIREDDGTDANALAHGGGSYASVFGGTTGLAPDGAPLPADLRVDVGSATDAAIADAVSRVLARYVRALSLTPDGSTSRPFRSPFDAFLAKNGLPTAPDLGETDVEYGRRLRAAVLALASPRFVDVGAYRTHPHPFRFGAEEMQGLVVFLARPEDVPPGSSSDLPGNGVGSCVSCHAPPAFTDGRFHDVGASQVEYDAIHGLGAFMALSVPGLPARNASPDAYLPPSAAHPAALGPFRAAPSLASPGLTDLGVWNVFANPDVPAPQAALRAAILDRLGLPPSTTDDVLLPLTIGWMKTPTLRDLGHSAPYFHGGHVDTIEEAVQHYRATGLSARFGLVRNVAPEVPEIAFEVDDLFALAAFLRALDEDPP